MHCQISFLHLQMSRSVISKLIEAELCRLQDKYLLVSLLALVTIWKSNVVLKRNMKHHVCEEVIYVLCVHVITTQNASKYHTTKSQWVLTFFM